MFIGLFALCLMMDGAQAVVHNPVSTGSQTLVFQEDLRFGGQEDDDVFYWNDGQKSVDFAIAPNGHFFIMDLRNSQILEFDTDGQFVKVFAKKGQGPGEYQNLMGFHINADGSAVGLDLLQNVAKLSIYDTQRNFVKHEQVVGTNFYSIHGSPDGEWIYAWFFDFDEEARQLFFKTGLFDDAFQLKRLLSSAPMPIMDPSKQDQPGAWADYLAGQFEVLINRGTHMARFAANGQVTIAASQKYHYEVLSHDLSETTLIVEKEYTPILFGDDQRQAIADFVVDTIYEQSPALSEIVTPNVARRAMQEADLPRVKNPITDMVVLPDGHTLVLHDVNLIDGTFNADIFSPDGKCIGQTQSPGQGIYDFFGTRDVAPEN